MGRTVAALSFSMMLTCCAADAASADDELNGAGTAQAVQQAILSKPGGADSVMSLQNDPNVKSLLQDEGVMRAVRSGNFAALAQDRRVEALMRNPTVRALAGDLQP
ncbi:MAG: hypothetical protein P8R42_23670 [Candidatus Binatia bacterium]|nr:hypothetical protein [Candidatus Binatia bacterium]